MESIAESSALSEALAHLLGDETEDVLQTIDPDRISAANSAFVNFLVVHRAAELFSNSPSGGPDRHALLPDSMAPAGGVRFIRVSDGAKELAFPILGAFVAYCHFSVTGDALAFGEPAIESAHVFWNNVITLRLPDDADAISVVRCLARTGAKARLFRRHANTTKMSTTELMTDLGLDRARTNRALMSLLRSKLVEVEWAQHADDFDNQGNRWSIGL
jgi:hypothetical protein